MVMTSCLTVSGPSSKIIAIDRIAVVMASWPTLIAPSRDRMAITLDCIFMVMTNGLTESVKQHMYPIWRDK